MWLWHIYNLVFLACSLIFFQIEMSTDIESFFDAVDPIKPLLDYIGGLSLAVNPKKKNELVHALCRHIVVTRVEKSLLQ